MRLFFGILIGLLLAIGIAVAAGYHAFSGLGDISERNKENDITRTIEVSDFEHIDVAGVFEIDVTVGGDYSVVVSGSQSEMERLEVSVENGSLKLDRKDHERGFGRWRDMGLTAEITLPALQSIDIAGVADGDVRGVDSERFVVDLSGVGDLNISGTCGKLVADVSGVGDLNARELECREVDVDVSGVGEATVYASEEVDAAVNGIGSISIYGSPSNVDKSSTFLSNISVK